MEPLVVRKNPESRRGTKMVRSQRGLCTSPQSKDQNGCWKTVSISRSPSFCLITSSTFRRSVSRISAVRCISSFSQPTTTISPFRFFTQSFDPEASFSERISTRVKKGTASLSTAAEGPRNFGRRLGSENGT